MKKLILLAFAFIVMLPINANAQISDQIIYDTIVAYDKSNALWRLATTTTSIPINSLSVRLQATTTPEVSAILRFTCFANTFSSSQAGCTNTSPINATSSLVIAYEPDIYTFTFATSSLILQAGKSYIVEILVSGGSIDIFGKDSVDFATQCRYPDINGTEYCTGTPFMLFNSEFLAGLDIGVATTSSLFSGQNATSTLASLAEQCSQQTNLFAEGICIGFSFLFVPSPQTLGQFSNLKDTISDKFPFAYVSGAIETWNSLTASTTLNAPVFSYDLADLQIGSTTPMGNILPDITVFSSSTVKHYFPAGTFDLLKNLAGIAILLTLIADIFFTSRNLMHS